MSNKKNINLSLYTSLLAKFQLSCRRIFWNCSDAVYARTAITEFADENRGLKAAPCVSCMCTKSRKQQQPHHPLLCCCNTIDRLYIMIAAFRIACMCGAAQLLRLSISLCLYAGENRANAN